MFQKLFFLVLLFISVIFLSSGQFYTQEKGSEIITINERMGDVIDLEKRNTYSFFLNIKGLQSAFLHNLYGP